MYNNQLKNIEIKLLKKVRKSDIEYYSDDEFEMCKELRSNGFLKEININGHIGFTLADRGIIYLEEKHKVFIDKLMYNVLVPFFFFVIGVLSANFNRILDFILQILNKN